MRKKSVAERRSRAVRFEEGVSQKERRSRSSSLSHSQGTGSSYRVVLARVAAWGGRIWRAAILRNLMRGGCQAARSATRLRIRAAWRTGHAAAALPDVCGAPELS